MNEFNGNERRGGTRGPEWRNGSPRKARSIGMSDDLYDRLIAFAGAQRKSRSQVVIDALEHYFTAIQV